MAERLRLDKAVAHNFSLTRLEASKYIKAGYVQVNGVCVDEPAAKILFTDELSFSENTVNAANGFKKRVFMLNKPQGYICADKDRDYPLVVNLLSGEPNLENLHCVGRLDLDVTGLMLLTDDGDFNHRVTSPKFNIPKTYEVETLKPLTLKNIEQFKKGLKHPLEKKRYESALLEIIADNFCRVTVHEGRYHEVKRLFECIDNEVVTLKRTAIGHLFLDETLDYGEYKLLDDESLSLIFQKSEA